MALFRHADLVAEVENPHQPPQPADAKVAAETFADQLEDRDIPRVKKVLQTLVDKILVESRSAIKPFISLPLGSH
jgi:hypothetical protein